MHPRTTNISTQTRDVYRFGFESAGAFEFANEYSGLAVVPAHLYCLRRTQECMSLTSSITTRRLAMHALTDKPFRAYVGAPRKRGASGWVKVPAW